MSVGLLDYQASNVPVSVFSTIGIVEESAVERLDRKAAEVGAGVQALLSDLAEQLVSCSNAKEFREYRQGVFASYLDLMVGLSSVLSARINPRDLPGIISASFSSLQSEFGSVRAKEYFGSEIFLEIQFSISTLKGALKWIPYLIAHRVDDSLRQQDQENAREYTLSVAWTQFHLAALGIALAENRPVASDVLQELLDGLRSSVRVYAYVRQGLDLRNVLAEQQSEELDVPWDAEDEALAKAD